MDGPVARLKADASGAPLEEHGAEGLGDEDDAECAEEEGHDSGDVSGPAPAEMALYDEAANNGTSGRANEGGACKDSQGNAAVQRVPKVGELASNNTERSRTKHAAEEAADHDGLQILCHGDGDLENSKDEEADEEWVFPSIELG